MNEKFRDINYGEGRSGRDCNDNDNRQSRGRKGHDCSCDRNERARLLKKIQQLNFMMIEAGLFLNNQCNCEAAQEVFCEYQRRHAEAKAEYEKCYGPLTYEGINVKRDGWSWINGPWPWEVEDC